MCMTNRACVGVVMNIKMIAVDLDGTLLRDDKTISDITISTLRKCRDRGIKVVYATARGNCAEHLISPDLVDGYVRMNGAVAYADDTPVHKKFMSSADVRDFLISANKANIQIAAEQSGWTYANFTFPEDWDPIFRSYYEISDFRTLDVEIEKIWAMPKSEAEIEVLKAHLPEGLYLVTTRDDYFTMIMHEEASKSKAIAALAEHWGIKSTEIAAFGDDIIDIDMLQHCGIGVAMENAIDEVKTVADYICDTNENDGVAKWIEEYVLSNRDG